MSYWTEYRKDGKELNDTTYDGKEPEKGMICSDYVLWAYYDNNANIMVAVIVV